MLSVPEPLQRWHRPSHGESQHTPSTQLPVGHCPAPVQAAPCATSGLHVPSEVSHQWVARHWPSPVQLVGQPLVTQAYGAQSMVPRSTHTPAPLHWSSRVKTLPTQFDATHCVARGHNRQLPFPSQVPSSPQPLAGAWLHSLSGSWPAAIGPQAPSGA